MKGWVRSKCELAALVDIGGFSLREIDWIGWLISCATLDLECVIIWTFGYPRCNVIGSLYEENRKTIGFRPMLQDSALEVRCKEGREGQFWR